MFAAKNLAIQSLAKLFIFIKSMSSYELLSWTITLQNKHSLTTLFFSFILQFFESSFANSYMYRHNPYTIPVANIDGIKSW